MILGIITLFILMVLFLKEELIMFQELMLKDLMINH